MEEKLPERIGRLSELANNLWWAWNPAARNLFRSLDYPLWRISGHNAVKLLHDISPDRLQAAINDAAFIRSYDSVMAAFDSDMKAADTWFAVKHPDLLHSPVAYFSMEFAIHNSLPIYAGGLGILAGDVCKESSDLGIPLVGVGFMYPQGYFHQHISSDGWQEEIYRKLSFDEAPINQALNSQGGRVLAAVDLDERRVSVAAWELRVGRVRIYLLDTDIEENSSSDRQLSARLYTADPEIRMKQEIILGIGGVRLLKALGIEPIIWHANEGHTTFMMLERAMALVRQGISFAEAASIVRATTVFTTHTPVPAGHDVFPAPLVEKHLRACYASSNVDAKLLLQMGRQNGSVDSFNMTALGLHMAEQRLAVSELHADVTRKMWHVLWPEVPEEKVPISHVTNGIHIPTWIAPEMDDLYQKYLGQDWLKNQDDPEIWEGVSNIPDAEIWRVRQRLKRKLIHIILERAQEAWTGEASAQQVLGLGALLDHHVLTIGFVRRFAEYKRPALIFRDIERLKRIVKDVQRPVQFVFAGKSHPADFPAKHLLRQVYSLATDRAFQGRIAFVEDYDMHLAHYLVQGVDLWLNVPRRLREACGTSGMKAALNGVLHMSVPDGWWKEGYNGANGWSIGDGAPMDDAVEDELDAEAIYKLLEEEVVPLYYDRDRSGIPHGWLEIVKESIASLAPQFSARRMMKDYASQIYVPLAHRIENPSLR